MQYKFYQWITTFALCLFGSSSKTDKNIFTPDRYPLLTSPLCSKEYLKLAYICDPNHSLSHTEALKINNNLNREKFSPCSYSTPTNSKLEQNSKAYILGLALASFMIQNDTDCGNVAYDLHLEEDDFNDEIEPADKSFNSLSNNIAFILRDRWSQSCDYDILIFIAERLQRCPDTNELLFKINEKPYYFGIAVSERVQKLMSPNIFNGLRSFTRSTSDNTIVGLILEIFSTLDEDVPYLNNRTSNPGQFRRVQSMIPTWALIVFVVCLSLTFVCTALGHWVNTGDSRGRFHSPDTFLFARGHSNDRRWRAGFAGGMMELHSAQQNTAGGRQSCRNGNNRKGKMFGAISMGNKKNNNAQYNYQRV